MNLFRRGGSTALSTSAIFQGIGANAPAPAAAVPVEAAKKADDEDMKDKEDDKTVPAGSDAKRNPDDMDPEDDENEDCEGDDESDDEDMKKGKGKKSAVACARHREKARVSAIVGHAEATGRTDFALHLALNTNLPRSQAIGLLKTAPKAAKGGLTERMAPLAGAAPAPNASPEATLSRAIAANWEKAFEKHAVTKKS